METKSLKVSFILQTGNDITDGMSVETLKKGQPLILGASNTEVLTMKVDSGLGIISYIKISP